MKSLLPAFLFLLSVSTASAYNPISVEPPQPYDIVPVEGDPYVQREYLGDLEDYPDMFEVTSEVAFTLKVKIRQRAVREPKSFALIVVRQNDNDGGVTEVTRLNQPPAEWVKIHEPSLGMTFLESDMIEKEVPPGTYRVEISTPDNIGDYMLVIGDESYPSHYFKALGQIFITQLHFNHTPLRMLLSSYVYYPLGILLIIVGMVYTFKYRKQLRIKAQALHLKR